MRQATATIMQLLTISNAHQQKKQYYPSHRIPIYPPAVTYLLLAPTKFYSIGCGAHNGCRGKCGGFESELYLCYRFDGIISAFTMVELTSGGVLLAFAASYLAASLTLFYYPLLLHKKRRYDCPLFNQVLSNKQRIMKVAHRGGSRVCMENTLEGFKDCVNNYKPDMLEMDVCFTKDRKLVVHHDSNLVRTCGLQDFIEHIEYDKLPNFQAKVPLDFAYRQYNQKTTGLRIPLLEEIFKQFPTMPMNIEIKTPSHEAIEEFRNLLKKYKREHLTIWGIRGPLHEKLKQPGSHTLTFFNDTSVGKLFLLYITGLLPFCKIRDDSLQLPLWTDEFHRWKLDTQSDPAKVNMFFKGLKVMNWMLPPLIRHLRKRGILTIMWVCNTEEEFSRAVQMGCEGIMTDVPGLLDQYLDKRFPEHS